MPLLHLESPKAGCRLVLWEITETEDELKDVLCSQGRADLMPTAAFRSLKRRIEWLATRCAYLQIHDGKAAGILYDERGKPFPMEKPGSISISHAWPFISLIEHVNKSVGVDIENITGRITNIARKFINKEEEEWIPASNNLRHLYLVWAAKEAVYKMKGVSGVDFRLNMSLSATTIKDEGETVLVFSKNDANERFKIYYRFLDGMILVYTIANNSMNI